MRLIDANVFLRYYLEDVNEQREGVCELMRRLESGEERAAAMFAVISEVVFTLERSYNISRENIQKYIQFLLALHGLIVEHASLAKEAIEIYGMVSSASFVDAVQIAYMRQKGIQEIYSFDKDFDKFQDIKRVDPRG